MNNIYIHIGYPKAASTTLQKHLFNQHSEINNLGTFPTGNLGRDTSYIDYDCHFLKNENLRKFYEYLVMLDQKNYNYIDIVKLYQKQISALLEQERVNLLSNERFTSVFFSYSNLEEKAHRLYQLFPHAKIIIIIRNQLDILKSQYRDRPFEPTSFFRGRPVSFDKWVTIAYQEDQAIGYLQSLKYDTVVKTYIDLYGQENIGVFLFEDLVQNFDEFTKNISNFMKIDCNETRAILKNSHENNSVSHRYNFYRKLQRQFPIMAKIINKLLPMKLKSNMIDYLKKGEKEECQVTLVTQGIIKKYFKLSNQRLIEQTDLQNMIKYKYPL